MLVHKPTKKLLLNLREPDAIAALIPGAKVVNIKGHDIVSVPHDLDTVRVLRNMGIKAPSPMLSYYEWAGRYTPFTHQRETSEFLTLNPRSFVLNDMGTGKTNSALWSYDYLRKAGIVDWCLVVSPLSTLERVWADEVFRHFSDMSYGVVHGSAERRIEVAKDKYDIYIINHDGLKIQRVMDVFQNKPGTGLVIVDECFPAGTMIAAPNGDVAIDTLKVGDVVCSSWGPRPVTHIFKKHVSVLVDVEFENGQTIRCTPEHPFATDSGWVPAKELAGKTLLTHAGLQLLRERVHQASVSAEEPPAILLSGLLDTGPEIPCCDGSMPGMPTELHQEPVRPADILQRGVSLQARRDGCVGDNKTMCSVRGELFCQGCGSEVSAAAHVLPQVLDNAEMAGQQRSYESRERQGGAEAARKTVMEQRDSNPERRSCESVGGSGGAAGEFQTVTRREWAGDVSGREVSSRGATGAVHLQPPNTNETAERERISDVLQSGLWGCGLDDCTGSGWGEPQHLSAPGTGQEEVRSASGVRVARVSYIQCGGDEAVWNLEVEGPHDYIAGGVVVHNCAVFRNSSTQRWKALNALINGNVKLGRKPMDWVWALTGTPIPNEPTDAFAQLKLVTPAGSYPKYFGAFRDSVMRQISPFKWMARNDALNTIYRHMQPGIRFKREDCIDLPPTTYATREVELTSEQKKLYKAMMDNFKAEFAGGQITASNEAIKLGRLVQIGLGVTYDAQGEDIIIPSKPRTDVVLEIIEEAGAKVIVFSPYIGALKATADEIGKHYTVSVVYGGVSKKQRDDIFYDFMQPGGARVLVAHPACMAHGLTLTSADTIVWLAPHTSSETVLQANARIARPGQKMKTLIVTLVGSEVERRIHERQVKRESSQGVLLTMFE